MNTTKKSHTIGLLSIQIYKYETGLVWYSDTHCTLLNVGSEKLHFLLPLSSSAVKAKILDIGNKEGEDYE